MRDCTLHGHKALSQVLINAWGHVGCGHRNSSRKDESRDVHQASSLRWSTKCEFTSESHLASCVVYISIREQFLVSLSFRSSRPRSQRLAWKTRALTADTLKPRC